MTRCRECLEEMGPENRVEGDNVHQTCFDDMCDHIWLPIALGKMCQRCFLYISRTGIRMKFKSLDAFKKMDHDP